MTGQWINGKVVPKCLACGAIHEVVDVGEDEQPEYLCRPCILENVSAFEGEPVNDLDLSPFEVAP